MLKIKTNPRYSVASPMDLSCSHAAGFVFSCSNPTGNTVIIGQPTSNLGPESPEGQSQPIPLPMPMPPPEPKSPTSTNPAGEENPGETLPESKWLVRATVSRFFLFVLSVLFLYKKSPASSVLPARLYVVSPASSLIDNKTKQKKKRLCVFYCNIHHVVFVTCMSVLSVCFVVSCVYTESLYCLLEVLSENTHGWINYTFKWIILFLLTCVLMLTWCDRLSFAFIELKKPFKLKVKHEHRSAVQC